MNFNNMVNNHYKGSLDTMTSINTTPNHVYYDIIISNRSTKSVEPQRLVYDEKKNTPYLTCPQDYLFSIIRFSLDTPTLPVFIPTMDLTNVGNINPISGVPQPTIYSITLTYYDIDTDTTYVSEQTYVNWIPQDQFSPPPTNTAQTSNVAGLQDITNTTYYYCYSFQWLISLINTAFSDAFISLQNVVKVDGITLPVSNAPFLNWDIGEGLAVLNADVGTQNTGGFITPPLTIGGTDFSQYSNLSIFFNNALYNIFNSFPMIQYGYGDVININGTDVPGGNIQIPITTYAGQNTNQQPINCFNIDTTYTCAQVSQEYSTIPIMSPVDSIVFTSGTIPVRVSNMALPYVYDGNLILTPSNNANIISMITDFQSVSHEYRSYIQYSPNVYRYLDMLGNQTLSNLDIYCYWKGRDGLLRPLYLASGGTCSIKLMFQLKDQ
jgi:hypothetical protein